MPAAIKFKVNDREVSIRGDRQRPLLDALREDLQLTGTKYGCGESRCGACTVLIDGMRAFSCGTMLGDVEGKSVVTIESLARDGALHPVQQAFIAEGASQCGYCTPGMVMAAVALLQDKPKPSDAEILAGMNENICRCCNYVNILAAVKRAADGIAAR